MRTVPQSFENDKYSVALHYTTGQVEHFGVKEVPHFEWIQSAFGLPYGCVYLDKREGIENGIRHTYEYVSASLQLVVERTLGEDGWTEAYTLTNTGKVSLDIEEDEVGVYVGLGEDYDIEAVQIPRRAWCHAVAMEHLYVACQRMDGTEGGVGLVSSHIGRVHLLREPGNRSYGKLAMTIPVQKLGAGEQIAWSMRTFYYADNDEYWREVEKTAPRIAMSAIYPQPGERLCIMQSGCKEASCEIVAFAGKNQVLLGDFCDTIEITSYMENALDTPRGRLLADCLVTYEATKEKGDKAMKETVSLLRRYLSKAGRHIDAFVPVELMGADEQCIKAFVDMAERALHYKGALPRKAVLSICDVLVKASRLWGGHYTSGKDLWMSRARALLITPFGPLFGSGLFDWTKELDA